MTKGPDGFSLIESMLAIVLMVIALMGLAPLLTSAITGDAASRAGTAAATLAEAKVEQLKSVGYADEVDGNDSSTVDGAAYNRAWVVTDVIAGALRKVEVTVTWGSPTRQVVLSAYMAKPS